MLKSDPDLWNSGEPGITNDGSNIFKFTKSYGCRCRAYRWKCSSTGNGLTIAYYASKVKNGILILETMNTGELVRENVDEFMFDYGRNEN